MAAKEPDSKQRVDLRKYPNRRYYDTTRSRHVTLDEIYAMIRAGSDVHVTDSKSGEDITAKVLAQIILDHDPPKLGIFPVEMLHQLIRANEPLIRDFIDKYFNQAWKAFFESQRQFDKYLRQALGLQPPLPLGQDWMRMMMGPLGSAFFGNGHHAAPTQGSPQDTPADPDAAELRKVVKELKEQVEALQRELARQKSPAGGSQAS
jgi:polyhydroxyalkanoate synthesis repressor PhaR